MKKISKDRGVQSVAIAGLVILAMSMIGRTYWPAFVVLGVVWAAAAVVAVRSAGRA